MSTHKQSNEDDRDGNHNESCQDESNTWLHFSQVRPHASLYLHQAAAVLHALDESLTCSLCRKIFHNPVSVQPCHHSFCNDCIHAALRTEKAPVGTVNRCPYCRNRLDERLDLAQCIVHNRNFEEAARHYKTLRPLLEKALHVSTAETPPFSNSQIMTGGHHHGGMNPRASSRKKRRNYAAAATGATAPMDPDARLAPADSNSITADSSSISGSRKLRNPFIRQQFQMQWDEMRNTWNFNCVHCKRTALRSKTQTWNASILTEHICHKCSASSDTLKQQAIQATRLKAAPNYSHRVSGGGGGSGVVGASTLAANNDNDDENNSNNKRFKIDTNQRQPEAAGTSSTQQPQQSQDSDGKGAAAANEDDSSYEPYL